MPVSREDPPVARVARLTWLLLAALDACLLVYLTWSYRWFSYEIPSIATPAASLVYAIILAVIGAVTAFEVALVAVIGAGVARQFRPNLLAGRGWAILAAIPALALVVTLVVWAFYVWPLAKIVNTARVDRLGVFEQLAGPAGDRWYPSGLVESDRVSVGLYLIVLLAIAYLAEKYCLAWLRVKWPVPLLPVAMVASVGWIVTTGERVQREFVASRQWRVVARTHTFPQALEACAALGAGWTLPRASELQLYFSTRPDAIRAWTGVAWTNTAAEQGGTSAMVVELAARKSGVFRRPESGVWLRSEVVNRSVSACEIDTRTERPVDVFTSQRARLCDAIADSPRMHSTTLRIVVLRRGTTAEFGEAATICVNRGSQGSNPGLGGRKYRAEREFSTAAEYLDSVSAYCSSRSGLRDFICFALADDVPAFGENDIERTYRLACDHEGRKEGCAGYAKMMEERGEAERAREYRERANASRRR